MSAPKSPACSQGQEERQKPRLIAPQRIRRCPQHQLSQQERTFQQAPRRRIDGIAQKTLTQALRRLERNGILERRLIDTAPPSVEYMVTLLGRSLDKPFAALNAWTMEHAEALRAAQKAFDERHGSVSERRG
jgi:DNA-binding HxlR family transcriptional regulator